MKYLIPVVLALFGALALVGCARKPLTPGMPWADLADDSLAFFALSTDPGGLKVSYTFDWGEGSTTTTDYFESGDTGYCVHQFSDTRVHYIRVMSRNEKGAHSGWSPLLRFRLTHPPQLADTMTGLPRWAVDRWYHASVRVTDPDGDSVAARFVWGDLPATGWSAFHASGSVIADSCKWSVIGPHTAGVVLRDKGGTISRPSAVQTVNVSSMAVVWDTYDEELLYDGTPTLGLIDDEPVLYGISYDGILDCYTLDGRLLWSRPVSEGNGYAASLSADGSRLYLAASNGLLCVNSRTGQSVWSLDTCDGYCTPALGPDGAIYVVTSPECACYLQRVRDCGDSAVVQWTLALGDWGQFDNGAVVGRNGVVYAVGYDSWSCTSFLVAVDTTGAVVWQDSGRIRTGCTPVIDSRDRVIVADQPGGIFCYNPDGTLAWSIATGELSVNSIAIGQNDEVIITDLSGCVWNYDSNGQLLWSSPIGIYGENTPCIALDGTVIAFDPEGYVYDIDNTGQVLWSFSVMDSLGTQKRRSRCLEGGGSNSAVIGPNGDLYLATCYALVCVSHGGLRVANTAWPTYNHDNAHSGWAGRP